MAEYEDLFEMPIPINSETLNLLAPMWKMKIHGDYYDRDAEKYAWDLEFPDMNYASNFAVTNAHNFQSIDIRRRDRIDSIHKPVVLTAIEKEPRK